jgi:uncharacterized protein YecE (DUF72 family)
MGEIRIGTSGWHYDHWIGDFYPEQMPVGEALEVYAQSFDTAEINNSFYSLPSAETLKQWAETVPGDFLFSAKVSRYLTHMKKLKDPREPLERFLSAMEPLGGKLGPLLFQLPPNWNANPERLAALLEQVPEGRRAVVEPRDESWWSEEVYEVLRGANAAFCIHDIEGRQSPREVTADFVYIRLHGPSEEKYHGSYSGESLSGWAGAISAWARGGRDVFCYFDNDAEGHAPHDAARLLEMVGGE